MTALTPEALQKIRDWDAKCTWPESAMFGVTLDRRRCLEHIDAQAKEIERLNGVVLDCANDKDRTADQLMFAAKRAVDIESQNKRLREACALLDKAQRPTAADMAQTIAAHPGEPGYIHPDCDCVSCEANRAALGF